ncbi:MAG: helix-turn-helix domain-containing protein [Mogibacterium sp.]|nr:helix-turn-helix domain-containing protein [Mogibacterium sp.]
MYVTAKEVAQHLGVAQKTVYKWARQGEIPCRRFGRTVKFSIEAIEGGINGQKSDRPDVCREEGIR